MPVQRLRQPALLAFARGHGDDQMGDVVQRCNPRNISQEAQDRNTGDPRRLLARVVIEPADHHPALLMDARYQAPPGLASTQHQRPVRFDRTAAAAQMLVKHAVTHARHRQTNQAEKRMQGQHRPRHPDQLRHQHHRRAERAGDRTGCGQPLQLTETAEAPQAFGHFEQIKHQRIEQQQAEQDIAVVIGPRRDPALETNSEQIGHLPGQGHHGRVEQQRQGLAVAAQADQQPVD